MLASCHRDRRSGATRSAWRAKNRALNTDVSAGKGDQKPLRRLMKLMRDFAGLGITGQ
jgi:hypothetical protein